MKRDEQRAAAIERRLAAYEEELEQTYDEDLPGLDLDGLRLEHQARVEHAREQLIDTLLKERKEELEGMSDEELLALLFTRPRPMLHVEGVVVLRNDAFAWEQYEPRKYVHRTAPAAIIDLSLVLVGIGTHRGESWAWSDGVFA